MPSVLSRLRALSPLSLKDATPALVGIGAMFAVIQLYKRHYKLGRHKALERFLSKSDASKKQQSDKAHVDSVFLRRLLRILRILIPSPFSMELLFMALIALTFLLRTYADVWMIQTSTKIEASIISRNKPRFWKSLTNYLLCMPLVSVVNSFLRLSLRELKLRFRERLTHHFYAQYLDGLTFYKMTNLDNRIANADQLLTQDVDRFCESIVELYSNLAKPFVNVLLYVSRIGASVGWQAPLQLFAYLLFSGTALTYLRRPIGRMTVMEQQLEGDYRFVNSRLIVNSEEIAFYQGNERERISVLNAFERMIAHLRSLVLFRFSIAFMDNIVAKYVATAVGWSTLSRPYFNENNEGMMRKNKTELVQAYYSNGRMMVKLADALGRLAMAGRELTRLAGFTARIDQLMGVLADLGQGKYQRTMVNTMEQKQLANGNVRSIANGDGRDTAAQLAPVKDGREKVHDDDNNTALFSPSSSSDSSTASACSLSSFRPGTGRVLVQDNLICFQHVPLVTPNGDMLVRSLDFEVPSGTNVLVCGPNGCGKSSLFRVLGELWPLWGGTLIKPAKGKLFYVPQRPYMTIGTLRDQVIYPERPAEMRRRGFTDSALEALLEHVQLRYILDREGGWEGQQDWMDVLSGGEKQRIAMARLFYHSPQFAILDECTSAVSADVEDAIYRRCHELGITLFTVSHRKSLWKHHDFSLHMDGRGHYEFKRINHDNPDEQFGS